MKVNNEDQFTKACDEYSTALFRYCCFKISDKEVAKDLLQETYMKAWVYITKGEEIQNIRPLFYRILSNLIIDHYRKQKSVSLDTMTEAGFDPIYNDGENLENRLDGEIALKALNEIPEIYREVIFMRYVQDLTLKEIAEITQEPENTISVKIHRGLKKVEKIFNKSE